MPRAGFGKADESFFLDPGDELVGLQVVGEGFGEGGVAVEGEAFFQELGGTEQGLLCCLDFVGQGGHLRLSRSGLALAAFAEGFDDVGFVLAEGGRE